MSEQFTLEVISELRINLEKALKDRDRFAEKYINVCESEERFKEKLAAIKQVVGEVVGGLHEIYGADDLYKMDISGRTLQLATRLKESI